MTSSGVRASPPASSGRPAPAARLAGRAAGVTDAKKADAQVKRLGLVGIPIYFAVDFDGSWGQVAAYFDGVVAVLGKARAGVYGSYSIVESAAGTVDWLWQTYAWSGGRVSSKAHVLQWKNGVTIGGLDCDLDKASAKGLESLRGPGAGERDLLSYLTVNERSDVLRLEKYRYNARKRGKWIDSERKTAEGIKDRIGRSITNIKEGYEGLTAAKKEAYLSSHHRRERLRILRNSLANRPLDTGF